MKSSKRQVICISTPLEFKDLGKHEKDTLFEHWVCLARAFYSDHENRLKFEEWKNKKGLVADRSFCVYLDCSLCTIMPK